MCNIMKCIILKKKKLSQVASKQSTVFFYELTPFKTHLDLIGEIQMDWENDVYRHQIRPD